MSEHAAKVPDAVVAPQWLAEMQAEGKVVNVVVRMSNRHVTVRMPNRNVVLRLRTKEDVAPTAPAPESE